MTATTGLIGYYPEMTETKPEAKIEASLAHYGRHWFLRVHPSVERLTGRGVEFMEIESAASLVPGSKYAGWSRYKVTENAFQKICKAHRVSMEMML